AAAALARDESAFDHLFRFRWPRRRAGWDRVSRRAGHCFHLPRQLHSQRLKDRSPLSSLRVGRVAHHFIGDVGAPVTGILHHDAPHLAQQAMPEDERPAVRQRLLADRDVRRQPETALGARGLRILLGTLSMFLHSYPLSINCLSPSPYLNRRLTRLE